MPTLPKPSEGNFTPPPAGTHLAACYRIIDLGTQQTEYNGQIKRQRKILLSWELPDELLADGERAGEPFSVHQRYTWSMHEKATLRQHLEAWRGLAFTEADFGPGGFEIQKILGKSCLLTIVHETKNGKIYANIMGIGKLPKGMNPKRMHNIPTFCWLSKEEFNQQAFDGLSDGLKQAIAKSPEYMEMTKGHAGEHVSDAHDERNPPPHADFDDAIPF